MNDKGRYRAARAAKNERPRDVDTLRLFGIGITEDRIRNTGHAGHVHNIVRKIVHMCNDNIVVVEYTKEYKLEDSV